MSITASIVLCVILAAQEPATDAAFFVGNGGLTAGITLYGGIAVCRWPSPGSPNQVPSGTGQGRCAPPGAGWQVQIDGQEVCPWREPWEVDTHPAGSSAASVETVMTRPDSPVRIVERVFVAHGEDSLVSSIRVEGVDRAPSFVWRSCFVPSADRIAGIPVCGLSGAGKGFATILVPSQGMTIGLRPAHPGQEPWANARALVSAGSGEPIDEWNRLGKGTWIVSAGLGAITGLSCRPNGPVSGAPVLSMRSSSHGWQAAMEAPCSELDMVAEEVNGAYAAQVVVGFGEGLGDALRASETIRRVGIAVAERETDAYWTSWIDRASLPDRLHEATCDDLRADLLSMSRCVDRNTGAVVTLKSHGALEPLGWLRDGVWVALAFDSAGLVDVAGKQLEFYGRCMRTEAGLGRPAGSWPAASYSDGVAGVPDVILDPGIGAWILGAFWRHAQRLPEAEGIVFLEARWSCIEPAVDFLVGWTDARNREPLSGFDRSRMRDSTGDMTLLEHFMGVDAGLRMAAALGKVRNEAWEGRKRALEALIRFHCVASGGQWTSAATLPFWQAEFRETALPSWEKAVEQGVSTVDGKTQPTARAVCDAALAFRGAPDRLNGLKPLIASAKPGANADGYSAALHFITIATIYGETR